VIARNGDLFAKLSYIDCCLKPKFYEHNFVWSKLGTPIFGLRIWFLTMDSIMSRNLSHKVIAPNGDLFAKLSNLESYIKSRPYDLNIVWSMLGTLIF